MQRIHFYPRLLFRKTNFKMKLFIYSTLFLLICNHAQSQATVRGQFKDENNMALAYASASLILDKDSSLVKGSLTDENGAFIIENVAPDKYRLLGSYLGYDHIYTDAFIIKAESKTATVDLNFQQKAVILDEATIVAKRPFLEQKADRMVVNVASSAVAAGGTAMEILQKVPGVIIVQDKITIGGSQNLQVYIDGKPSPYQDMNAVLRDMPGDQIEKIEFITQPGAQFDAAGGPILNLVLKRNADLGFKGTAAMTMAGYRYNQADVNKGIKDYHRLNPSLNLTYRAGKINLAANASYNKGNYFEIILIDRFIGNEIYESKNFNPHNYTFRNLRFAADYYASEKTTIGSVFRTWSRSGDGTGINETNVFRSAETNPYTSFLTDNLATNERSGTYANIYIKHEFNKKTGRNINIDLDYNRFKTRNINDLAIYNPISPEMKSLSRQDVDQPVQIIVGKLDYVHPFDSTFKAETGIKTSIARVDNLLNFYRNGERSTLESNDFLYDETINAAYTNLNKTISGFEISAGIRAEQTIVNGNSMGIDTLKRNYLQWFPSGGILYRLNQHMAIQSSYSRRVNRPGFQQQNPFSYFIDSLTYTRGNPQLRPEIINTAQLNLTFDGQPFFGIAYYTTDDVIIENAPKLEGTKTFTVSENLARQKRLEIQLNFPIKIGKVVDGFGGNQAIYNAYDANYQNEVYKASRWHWLAYWQINASLPSDFKVEFGGFYMTKFLEEFLTIDNIAGVNIGVSKSFSDKKGRISLSFNDIFYSQNTNAVINFANVNVNFLQREFNRLLRLTVSYQFGNTKLKNLSGRSTASESETSRVKVD